MAMKEHPFVSIIFPCRNEEEFIGRCLDSVVESDYPKDRMEALVVDGMSEDGTRDILRRYAARHPYIKVLDNTRRTTPYAFNTGIRNARGEVIMIMGAHATYARDYVLKCVRYLDEYGADNVGGAMVVLPREDGFVGKAVVQALSHRFGVGNAAYRTGLKGPAWVDTVFGGCYRRELFDRLGYFNEGLTRSQDMEFNLRLKKAGGRILFAPDIVCWYYARSDIRSLVTHNFNNGAWAVLPFLDSKAMPVSLRHFVPLLFVTALGGASALSAINPAFLWLLLLVAGPYALSSLYFSLRISIAGKGPGYLAVMPFVFAALHLSYGLGSMWGVARLVTKRRFWTNRVLGRVREWRSACST